MATQQGTLQVVGATLTALLRPLQERFAAGELRRLLAELGRLFPPGIDADPVAAPAVKAAADAIGRLEPILSALDAALQDENIGQALAKGLELADAVRVAVAAFDDIAAAVKVAGAGAGIPANDLNAWTDALPGQIVDYLIVRFLEAIPGVAESLDFIGAIDRKAFAELDPQHPAFVQPSIHIDKLTDFVSDPAAALAARFGWGQPGFTGVALLQKIVSLLDGRGVPALLDTSGPTPTLDVIFLEISPKTDDPKGLRAKIVQPFEIQSATPIEQDDWKLTVDAAGGLKVGSEILLTFDDGVTITNPGAAKAEGDLSITWTGGKSDKPPYLILGEPGGSRLEAKQFIVDTGVGLAWNASAGKGEGRFKIGGVAKGCKLAVSLANADGFIGAILGGVGLESDFDLGVGFSTGEGLFFTGSAGLEIQLPLHVDLGPVQISALTISAGLSGGAIPVGLKTNIKAALGPMQGVVEQIGVGADISFPADKKGNAGPIDFKLRFLPPKGVGLSLDLAVIKGGGYLFIDPDRGEYAGALELVLADTIGIQAIGLITTKLPDGSDGFSLLIMMSVDFGAGFQLGYGFTLSAIGGLVGLNRTMNLQALADGIRSGAIQSVMFPSDIIANAPKIISDLKAFFPPQEGKFLIGPMLKIGWGTPTLVSISLGVIIEIPGNVAIVGILRIALPTEDAAIINLQVNFIGAIEFDKERIWFFAALYDSRVMFLNLEGEMGLLVAYGDDANFVVSVGGFHPDFSPPPLPFPSPKRIQISLLSTPISMIRVECYFALTSNTAQFGARAEVRYGLSELNVSGHIAFDALFQFSPFSFIIQISASFSAKVFGIGLFSVGIRGSLSGPAPWHIVGRGEISLLFFDIGVDFETTWGEDRRDELPAIPILPLLEAELKKADNWRALPPVGVNLSVSLRSMSSSEAEMVLHPVGVLRISQRKMPLGLRLDTIGTQKPNDVSKVAIAVMGGGLAKTGDVFDKFAPAQFQKFTDAEKVSKSAFSTELAGLDLSAAGADMRSSRMVRRDVRYEEIIIDSNYKRFQRRFRLFANKLFTFFLNGAAITQCTLSQASIKTLKPFDDKVEILPESFAVVLQSNNKAFSATSVFHSEASAREFMATQAVNDASLADTLHVVPGFEVAA